jgi:hypothetical protein
MTKSLVTLLLATSFVAFGSVSDAAEDSGHHLPHNHIALIVGHAEEEQADGHHEDGKLFGIDYIRQFHEHWAWGLTLEQEGFGDNDQARHGILAVPVSFFVNDRWRVFAAPGIEFREKGERDKALFRLGTGYSFSLGKHLSLAPEVQIDFIEGGTKVFVFALALGYGF